MLINNRYELQDKIGQGAMGEVYRAADRLTGDTVALKQVFIKAHHLAFNSRDDSTEARVTLTHEFQTLATLHHPYIISVLDYGFDAEQQPFFTMKLLDNPQTILEAAQKADFSNKIHLTIQMLQAVAYLHRRGIIHRDLKPENVLINQDNQVQVLDFGLAIEHDTKQRPAGTLAYMAPETVETGEVSFASDLYAVGVMLYEFLAGQYPFRTNNVNRLISDIIRAAPDIEPLINNLPAETGRTIANVVLRLMSKNPEDRYQNTVDLIKDLCLAVDWPLPEESSLIRESFLQAATFVGRDRELNLLLDAVGKIEKREGSLWLIGGESGVGKSRLINELAIHALVKGAVVLRGQGVEGGGLPFQLWRDPLRRLVLTTELSDLEAGVIKEIIPDIDRLVGRAISPAPELGGEPGQQRLSLTIADVFKKQQQPVVLILEDLQWENESLAPLVHLVPKVPELPILVIGSYRDDERPDLPQLFPAAELLKLARLAGDEISALSVSMIGESGKRPEVLQLLQKETEGNAFFLVEVIRALAEGAGRLSDIGRMTLPESVFAEGIKTVIQRRLARIPADYLPLLRLSAMAGQQLDRAVLNLLADGFLLDNWLYTCANAAIIEQQDQQWRFCHDKLREALLADTPPDARQGLHRRVAEAIETTYPDDNAQAEALMLHWREAGNTDKELHYLDIVTDRLVNFTADLDRAQRFINRGLELTADTDTRHFRLLNRFGTLYNRRADMAAVQKYARQAYTLSEQANDRHNMALSLAHLGGVAHFSHDYALAHTYLERSLAIQQKLGTPKDIAVIQNRLGLVAHEQGDTETAYRYQTEALATYRNSGDLRGTAVMLNNLGALEWLSGKADAAHQCFKEGFELAQAIGSRPLVAILLQGLSTTAKHEGHYQKAYDYGAQALAIYRETGETRNMPSCLLDMAAARLAMENADVQDLLHEALMIACQIEHTLSQLDVLTMCARWQFVRGNFAQAADLAGLVDGHPVTNDMTRQVLAPLVDDLREHMDQAELDTSLERGRSSDLDTTITHLLQTLTG